MTPTAPARPAPVRGLLAPAAVLAAAGVGCAVVLLGDPTTPGGPLPVCPTRALLGIDCPGCGSLRMLYSLLHADLGAALRYNAVSLLAVGLLAWSFATWTLGRVRGRRVWSWPQWRWAPITVGVVFALWFVVRNLPFAPFTALRV